MRYGLPGKPEYDYTRPFDYFDFELALDTANAVESVFSHGLLYGTDYEAGPNYRGLWGLYGIYDYIGPNIFKVSNTAGALGTTAQWWLSQKVALQGTALMGVGYAGGGVIHGSGVRPPGPLGDGQRNYHYGVAPESILARDGRYSTDPDSQQRVSTINIGYTLLGHTRFGAVDWRPGSTANSE